MTQLERLDQAGGVLSSYHLEFDAGIVMAELERLFESGHMYFALMARLATAGVCTLCESMALTGQRLKLDGAYRHFVDASGYPSHQAHDAVFDAEAAGALLFSLRAQRAFNAFKATHASPPPVAGQKRGFVELEPVAGLELKVALDGYVRATISITLPPSEKHCIA